ncbi:MAG: universal stress protein [Steroidobacteraceae bacterium]
MSTYKNILAVVDLGPDSLAVARRARELCAGTDARLTLLHVVEYVPAEPLSDALLPTVQIEAELLERGRERLAALAAELSPPASRFEVTTGNVKAEITRFARDGQHDLIVIGSHERHGLSILVNLTEDTVLHAAPCDVLAVRLAGSRNAP